MSSGSLTRSFVALLVALALLVAGCSIRPQGDDVAIAPAPNSTDASQIPPPSALSDPTPAPSPSPSPSATATPEPTPTAAPTATPEPVDDTPVVIQGDGWTITQQEIVAMVVFIEETHELAFRNEVFVSTDDDIGAEFAAGFEPFPEDDWILLSALGLTTEGIGREQANQVRLDRVRGACCRGPDEILEVIVEVQPTELATATVVVHELTHALHRQYPEFWRGPGEPSSEVPAPESAAFEGVPQFVAFAYLAQAPQADQDLVTPDLPIITDAMVGLVGATPARYLNFAYATGADFVDAVIADRGSSALGELIARPPSTTEQVLFPEKYLAGEQAADVAAPELPVDAQLQTTGTMGAAVLMFLLIDSLGPQAAQSAVDDWAGDRYVTFIQGDQLCIAASIQLDTPAAAGEIAVQLQTNLAASFAAAMVVSADDAISLRTC